MSPDRVKPKTIKLVFVAFPLSTQHSGVRAKTSWLGIGIICPSGATYLSVNCCFNELALYKYNSACWSSTKWISSSSHWKLTCFRHDIYIYNYNCWVGVKQQSLTHSKGWLVYNQLSYIVFLFIDRLICSSHTKISNENIGYCNAERYTCPQNEQYKY